MSTVQPATQKNFLARFKRVTSSGSYMPEIDGLRFVAILAVILFHAHLLFFDNPIPNQIAATPSWDWLNFAIGHGWFGVQVFFVISGFVLALPFAGQHLYGRKPIELKTYYTRRMVRIGFPYIIALTLGLIYALAKGATFDDSLSRYLYGLIYSHGVRYDGALNPILHVSWTLEIEIQFYILAPILCSIFMLKSFPLRTVLMLSAIYGSMEFADVLHAHFPKGVWKHSLVGQLEFFLAGLLLADVYLKYWKNRPAQRTELAVMDIVGIIAWLFIPFAINLSHTSLPFLLLLAFTCVLRGRLLKKLLSLPLVATIGGMCYSIYLFHGAILYFVFYSWIAPVLGSQKDIWPYNFIPLTLVTVITILICFIPYYFIERPSMRWGSKK